MATIADIVRRERKSGSSRTGALFSAVGKKTLETLDPRRLFNQTGLLTALFPSLKAFQSKGTTSGSKLTDASSPLASQTSPLLVEMNVRLTNMENISKITAKNSMALPGMSRDMNIMRQNVIKLVRLQGGKASTRADAFFLRAFERERATEAELQAAKERRATGSASPVTAIKESASTGILGTLLTPLLFVFNKISSLMGTLTEALSSLSKLIGPLLKGGISLLFDMAGSFTRMAIKGGGTLFDFIKKIPLTKMLRGLLSFVSSKGALGLLAPAAAAGLLAYLFTNEATQYGTGTEGLTPEDTQTPPPTSGKGLPQVLDERARAEKGLKAGKAADPDGSYANAEMRKFQRQAASTSPTPAGTPESTSPKLVPSLPSTELGGVDYSSYAQTVGQRESGGDYKAVNSLGYLGKYQFGAMALEDMGLVKRGVGAKGQKALDDPLNWTIDGGKEAFLNDPSLQEQTMLRYTKMNFERLKKLGVINDSTTAERIAGFLASAHLVGPGGAAAMSRGEIRKDAYGTSAQSYFKLGLASQDNIAPVSPSSGSQLASASTEVDSARMSAMAPSSIIPAMANLASPKTPSPQRQQVSIPSTIDTDLFEGLVARVSEFA